jgi:hypothetical protein
MVGRQVAQKEGSRVLASRIAGLEIEERDAVRRRDWSAARTIALERVTLKTAYYRAVGRRESAHSDRGRHGGRRG